MFLTQPTIWLMAWRNFFLLEPLLVRILVLSFLFKWESFSFVKGLWLLDLNNRKTFLWKFFWICFAFDVLKWWLACLQLTSIVEILVRSIFFRGYHCFVYRRAFWLERFCRGTSTRSVLFVLDQGVFISFIAIYDYFILLSCSIQFLYFVCANLIWLTFVHAG